MKIAFVHQPWNQGEPPVKAGSIAIWIYQVSQCLAQSNELIIYARRSRSGKKEEFKNGIMYRYVSTRFDDWIVRNTRIFKHKILHRLPALVSNPRRVYFSKSFHYLSYILQVALNLRKRRCDIVHIQNLSQFVPIIRVFNPGVKIALHMHCEWLTQLDRRLIEPRLNKTDLIIGCSEYITKKIRDKFPHLAERCQTIYNGVDVAHFNPDHKHAIDKANGEKRVLFVGRISPEKGLHVLFDAFQVVRQQIPKVRLEIVGPKAAPPLDSIFKLTDDLKVAGLASFCSCSYFDLLQEHDAGRTDGRVRISSALPHSQLPEYYCNADAYVQPSFVEAFPVPILEAMAAGIPVVATEVGGVPEAIVNGKTGLVVDRDNVEALAEALIRILADRALRISMGKAARTRAVEQFAFERISENLLNLYKRAMVIHE